MEWILESVHFHKKKNIVCFISLKKDKKNNRFDNFRLNKDNSIKIDIKKRSSLKNTGYSDRAIHDAVQIIGYFNYINRIADSNGVEPETFTHEWELSTPD